MNRYRIVEVTPEIVGSQVEVNATMSDNLIETTAGISTAIRHNTVSDYDLLTNKPQINSVTLQGDKSFEDLGLEGISNIELEELLK